MLYYITTKSQYKNNPVAFKINAGKKKSLLETFYEYIKKLNWRLSMNI